MKTIGNFEYCMPRISSSSLKKSNIKKNADLLIIHLRVSDQVYTLIRLYQLYKRPVRLPCM